VLATAVIPETAGPDLGVLGNYGVLGLFTLVLLGFGLRAWQREITRADRLETELREKNQVIQDKVVPALTTAAAAVQQSADLLRELTEERERDLRRQLDVRGR
jgi:hypothetical protein